MTTAAETVAEGQAAAESLMTDTCTITRGGTRTFNSTTGTYTTVGGSTVYTGACRVKPSPLSANTEVNAADHPVSLWPYVVSVPVTVDDVDLDDIVNITASTDPTLVDRRLRVRSVARGTYLTARRLDCEDTSDDD